MVQVNVTRVTAHVVANRVPGPPEDLYATQFKALLPRGAAWWAATRPELLSEMDAIIDGMMKEPARVGRRAFDLLRNMDPRTMDELLPDWERIAGLPDPCAPTPPQTIPDRQGALTARITARGEGTGPQFLLDLIADLGYTSALIRRFHRPGFVVSSHCNAPLNSKIAGWPFLWEFIVLPGPALNDILICQVLRSGHAHLAYAFAFPLVAFDQGTFVRNSVAVFTDPNDQDQTALAIDELGTAFFGV